MTSLNTRIHHTIAAIEAQADTLALDNLPAAMGYRAVAVAAKHAAGYYPNPARAPEQTSRLRALPDTAPEADRAHPHQTDYQHAWTDGLNAIRKTTGEQP